MYKSRIYIGYSRSLLIFQRIDKKSINDETIIMEGIKVIPWYIVTGMHIIVIAKVYIQNLREVPRLF